MVAALSLTTMASLGILAPASAHSARATQARASAYTTTMKDGPNPGLGSPGSDVRRVRVYSATDYEPAVVSVRFAAEQRAGYDGISVWFNLDRDKRPEAVLHALAYSEYSINKTNSWTKTGKDILDKNCFQPDLSGDTATVEFTPNCFGQTKTMAISVSGDSYDGRDYAPSRFKWSKRIRAWDHRGGR